MLRRPRGLFQLDDVALAEVGQRFGIGADGQHERHIMLLRVLFEAVKEPLRVGEVNLDQLEERVDEDGLDVVVAGEHAAEEAEEHFRAGNAVLFDVDETNRTVHFVHIAVVLVEENDVAGAGLDRVVGHVNQPLGLAGALLACDNLNHG